MGGSEVLVVGSMGSTVGAICNDDYKGSNRQYVEQGKLILCKNVGVSETDK